MEEGMADSKEGDIDVMERCVASKRRAHEVLEGLDQLYAEAGNEAIDD